MIGGSDRGLKRNLEKRPKREGDGTEALPSGVYFHAHRIACLSPSPTRGSAARQARKEIIMHLKIEYCTA